MGEVDGKGKARRLPVKANIRKALSFPGGSMLMVAQLKKVMTSKISLRRNTSFQTRISGTLTDLFDNKFLSEK